MKTIILIAIVAGCVIASGCATTKSVEFPLKAVGIKNKEIYIMFTAGEEVTCQELPSNYFEEPEYRVKGVINRIKIKEEYRNFSPVELQTHLLWPNIREDTKEVFTRGMQVKVFRYSVNRQKIMCVGEFDGSEKGFLNQVHPGDLLWYNITVKSKRSPIIYEIL